MTRTSLLPLSLKVRRSPRVRLPHWELQVAPHPSTSLPSQELPSRIWADCEKGADWAFAMSIVIRSLLAWVESAHHHHSGSTRSPGAPNPPEVHSRGYEFSMLLQHSTSTAPPLSSLGCHFHTAHSGPLYLGSNPQRQSKLSGSPRALNFPCLVLQQRRDLKSLPAS